MKSTSALAIALLSITASASVLSVRGGARTACETEEGLNHWGHCRVYSQTPPYAATGEQYDCRWQSPCTINQNGCIIFTQDGKKVANCNG
ncbi:hypothetical protein EG328_003022 [Venturia inaequalis]|uniref:Uncharacterized protein n=1 Tax=Venturia inaequalis TaxID=5025 RepID=A0A8H3UTY6_VENIN|nr:hypothetical protein EG328_003022 [Venturia inaequalis]